MPEKKRQHYVPKSYMKAFSNNGKTFALYNIKDKTIHNNVPYDSQCYANYFYGEDKKLEDELGEKENIWKMVLDKVRNQNSLNEKDIRDIKEFAIFQRQRTLAESEYGNQEKVELYIECGKMICANKGILFDDEAKKECIEYASKHKVTPSDMLEKIEIIAPEILDLELLVIKYETKTNLISSDAPIIMINPFCPQQIGYGCMGLIILFPISPHQIIILYDAKMYPRYRGKTYISLSNEKEVHKLNVLQLISAEKILFGCDINEFLEFKLEEFLCRRKNRSMSKVNTLGPSKGKLMKIGLRGTIFDCTFSFGKIRTDFETVPRHLREAPPRSWEKGWEEKFVRDGNIVRNISNLKNSPIKFLNGKEFQRGKNKLLKCVREYWKE